MNGLFSNVLSRCAFVALALALAGTACGAGAPEVRSAGSAAVVIDGGEVVREELPPTLFGFNVQHHFFQNDLWREGDRAVDPKVIAALRHFPHALYRYPGGLVANRFWWSEAVGPPAGRAPQKAVQSDPGRPVLFGVEEYVEFVDAVGGRPWYVLNLVGWDARAMLRELPERTVAESNAALARLLRNELGASPRYYQLGNELDRADYQWPHDKYVARARSTIEAVRAADPDARFVAFLRDYDWKYRGAEQKRGVSRYQDLIHDVLTGLPEVDDFSLHFYYDDPGMTEKYKQIPWRLRQFQRAIDAATASRKGRTPGVWITEHARGANYAEGQLMKRAHLTSNLSAAISTADFLIGLAQMPAVRGAAWHGLNAGPWQLFDATIRHRDLRPRPVYFGLRALRAVDLPVVLAARTASPDTSGYGYDVRAAAFTDPERDALGIWAVNRSRRPQPLRVSFLPWKGTEIEGRHHFLAGEPGVDADDPDIELEIELDPTPFKGRFSQAGVLDVELPPSSVSGLVFSRTGAAQPSE